MDRKMVPVHRTEREMDLWEEAEKTARQELDAQKAREGEVLAQICAVYLGTTGPLNEGET